MDRGLHQQTQKTRLTGRSGVLRALTLSVCFTTLSTPVFSQAILEGERFHPASARHGMVATSHTLATEVALEVLQNGGNAVDAAVTAGFALAVTQPRSGNIGGGGMSLARWCRTAAALRTWPQAFPARLPALPWPWNATAPYP